MGRVVAEWAFGPIDKNDLLTEQRRLGEFQPLGDDFEKSVPLIYIGVHSRVDRHSSVTVTVA